MGQCKFPKVIETELHFHSLELHPRFSSTHDILLKNPHGVSSNKTFHLSLSSSSNTRWRTVPGFESPSAF